jgi:hypothetical protein
MTHCIASGTAHAVSHEINISFIKNPFSRVKFLLQQLATPSYQGPNKPSPHLPQYLYNTDFQKNIWCWHRKLVHMSYLFYDLTLPACWKWSANATKVMKCIKPYGYKKSSLISETTQMNNHMNTRKHFVLWDVQIFRIRWYNCSVCTQAHSTHNDFSHNRKLFLNPPYKIIGNLVGWNCILSVSLQIAHHSWLCSYECGLQEF